MLPSLWQRNLIADAPHTPVLVREIVAWLDLKPGMTVVDGTFGGGGHAGHLADAMGGHGTYIAIDRDDSVLPYFEAFRDRHQDLSARFVHARYDDAFDQLARSGLQADAVLLDIGLSSMQIDRLERGFSYATDAPLDMRMDPHEEGTAADLVNELSERELAGMFHRYGEERYARPIARAIVRRRAEQPFTRSGELVEVIRRSIPTPALFGHGHPAKRVFQALRIAVNDELGALEHGLTPALEILRPGGRIAVISFQSLEDRIVKQTFRERARGCICPPELPICACGHEPELRVLTPRVLRPAAEEVADNPRAQSSRLRVAERTTAPLSDWTAR